MSDSWGNKIYNDGLNIRNLRSYETDVVFGKIPGHRSIIMLGNNPSVDAGGEDIWTGGGAYPWMTGDTALEMVSDSTEDAPGGTGVQAVTILGLQNYVELNQVVALNGLTPVAVPQNINRINLGLCSGVPGSNETNVGTITIRDAVGGIVRAIIPAGFGITRHSGFTVPANHQVQVLTMVMSINEPTSTRDASISTWVRPFQSPYRMAFETTIDGNPFLVRSNPGFILNEKTDFQFRVNNVSNMGTDISAGFLGILKNMDYD